MQYGIVGGVDGITSNAASATALYVDSVIAPLLPELREDNPLDA